jgi:hypothetical protein
MLIEPVWLKPLGPVSEYETLSIWDVRPILNPISTVPVLSLPDWTGADGALVEGEFAPVEQAKALAVPKARPSASIILAIGVFIAITSSRSIRSCAETVHLGRNAVVPLHQDPRWPRTSRLRFGQNPK